LLLKTTLFTHLPSSLDFEASISWQSSLANTKSSLYSFLVKYYCWHYFFDYSSHLGFLASYIISAGSCPCLVVPSSFFLVFWRTYLLSSHCIDSILKILKDKFSWFQTSASSQIFLWARRDTFIDNYLGKPIYHLDLHYWAKIHCFWTAL